MKFQLLVRQEDCKLLNFIRGIPIAIDNREGIFDYDIMAVNSSTEASTEHMHVFPFLCLIYYQG